MARDLEMRAAIGDLAAGGVGAGLAGGDVAALRDRLPGVDVHRVEDAPLLAAGNPRLAGNVHLSFLLSSCSPNHEPQTRINAMCFLLNPAHREVDCTSFLLAKILGEESPRNKGKITCWCGRIPVAGVARGLGL